MTPSATVWACDTSVAVAALDPTHAGHAPCRRALVELRPVLAGHAAFESYSVLTRLPMPLRLTAAQADEVLRAAFGEPCWLDSPHTAELRSSLAARDVVGGAVYDALVGRAAAVHGRTLLTRDRRAERTYLALDIPHRFVE